MTYQSIAIDFLISQTPTDTLIIFFKQNPTLHIPGFKIDKKNLNKALVKKRISTFLAKETKYADIFLKIEPSPWIKYKNILEVLDETWVLENLKKIINIPDGKLFIPAAVLDSRQKISKLAYELLSEKLIWENKRTDNYEFLPDFSYLINNKREKEESETLSENKNIAIKSKTLEKALDLQKKQKEKYKNLLYIEQEKNKLNTSHSSKNEYNLKKQIKQINDELKSLKSNFKIKVNERINEYRYKTLNLKTIIEKTKILNFADSANIFEYADKILEEHKCLNEKFATKDEIRKEIYLLKMKLKQINNCLNESIVTLPSLNEVKEQITQKIKKLNSTLNISDEDKNQDYFIEKIIKTIMTSEVSKESLSKLNEIKALISNPLFIKTYQDNIQKISFELKKRQSFIENTIKEKQLSLNIKTKNNETYTEISNINNFTKSHTLETILFIDGYNIIKSVNAMSNKENSNFIQARNYFIDLCSKKSQFWENIELIFDGINPSREHKNKLSVVFTDNTAESQKADDYIIERMKLLNKSKTNIILASNDYDLRSRAMPYCQYFMRAYSLYNYLNTNSEGISKHE